MKQLEIFYNMLMMDDRLFYGVAGVLALLLILLLARLLRRGRIEEEEDLSETDAAKEDEEEIVDRVIGELDRAESRGVRTEKIEKPDMEAAVPEEPTFPEESERKKKRRQADTLEVYRHVVMDKEPEPEPEPEPKPEPEPEPEPAPEPEPEKTLEEGLAKTKGGFITRLNKLIFGRKKIDDDLMEELEEILYSADIGQTATNLFEVIKEQAKKKELSDPERIRQLLKDEIARILQAAEKPYVPGESAPRVILMVGVNGVGKTTTIGKLARQFSDQGRKVMLAAGDTFRAAAAEQLKIWGERSGVDVIADKEGANPSGVVYNAVQAAVARQADYLIVDTAGRLHTKYNLMEELRKIRAVTAKALGRDPDETWLVIDANTGQNAVAQAQKFNDALGLTGLVLTKLDGTAKGGVVIGITDQLGLPIRYIGIGEKVADLRPFKAADFVDALF